MAALNPIFLSMNSCFKQLGGRRQFVIPKTYHASRIRCSSSEVVPSSGAVPAEITQVKRDDFPLDFKFGGSTSAIQTEGNLTEGGRGPSTLDFQVLDSGYNAADSYNRYMDDVNALKNMGMTAYRFSISWTRILPKGSLQGGVNQEGIDFYNNFINALTSNGITPYVTLSHFEIPQALEDSYTSFLDRKIINDFKDYAEVCFKNFGDRVKHWTTLNEPYNVGAFIWKPSGVPDSQLPLESQFTATHNVILAHAAAVDLYRKNYKAQQKGEIGITLAFNWIEPFSDSPEDIAATERDRDFRFGWYMNPLCYGEYPKTMRDNIAGLPQFTDEEKKLVKGSYDFLGLNYYTASYAKSAEYWQVDPIRGFLQIKYIQEGECNSENVCFSDLGSPESFTKMLVYVKNKYQNPKIFITENGYAKTQVFTSSIKQLLTSHSNDTDLQQALFDEQRLYYIMQHLIAIIQAQRQGVNVTGYCVWSLIDSLELSQGYTVRMGLNFTDYLGDYERYPKSTAKWFSKFLNPHFSSVAYTPKLPQN